MNLTVPKTIPYGRGGESENDIVSNKFPHVMLEKILHTFNTHTHGGTFINNSLGCKI